MHPLSSGKLVFEVLGGPLAPLFPYFLGTSILGVFFVFFYRFYVPQGAHWLPKWADLDRLWDLKWCFGRSLVSLLEVF